MNQAFLTHIMHNFPWRIKSTLAFALGDVEHIFKHFPQHFRVNGYFFIQWFVFFDGKVVAVENIQNTCSNIARFVFLFIAEERFRNGNIGISPVVRSEEHTSELQSLMRISYAVFCLKKKKKKNK